MPRRIRESTLDSRDARLKLKVRGKPYWRSIGSGLHVGYRKGQDARRWVARIYIGSGQYVVETIGDADDFADADGFGVLDFWQAQEQARQRSSKRTAQGGQRIGAYTVGDAVKDYLDHIAERRSHYVTRTRLEAYLTPHLLAADLSKLNKADLVTWHRDLAKVPPRARTKAGAKQRYREVDMSNPETVRRRQDSANRILGMLMAALNLAVRDEKAVAGTWRNVKPFKDVGRSRTRYLTVAECQRLMNACDPDFRKLVHALLLTGCRYQEIARLRVEDFNPDSGTLHIRQSKTGKERHVVLTEEGQEFFTHLALGKRGINLVLGRVWGQSNQARPMALACTRAKIDPPIGLHQLRHTFASLAVMNGTPLMVVASALGHSSTRMVEKHYGHMAHSYVAEEIRRGAPRFGQVTGNVKAIR